MTDCSKSGVLALIYFAKKKCCLLHSPTKTQQLQFSFPYLCNLFYRQRVVVWPQLTRRPLFAVAQVVCSTTSTPRNQSVSEMSLPCFLDAVIDSLVLTQCSKTWLVLSCPSTLFSIIRFTGRSTEVPYCTAIALFLWVGCLPFP